MNTNLRPHFFTAQACLADMKEHGGSIINLGSNSAILGLAGYASYVTAKAGIIGLTKALARELGPHEIRVNALIPGWVLTDRQRELWATPEAVEECLAQQSLKRTISEEDVSNSALFLASDASAMITGQSLIIDGGRV
jgi:NAD(P)-dependent dehydrogenase (short-subunit alcohol dehydrogenase family)